MGDPPLHSSLAVQSGLAASSGLISAGPRAALGPDMSSGSPRLGQASTLPETFPALTAQRDEAAPGWGCGAWT